MAGRFFDLIFRHPLEIAVQWNTLPFYFFWLALSLLCRRKDPAIFFFPFLFFGGDSTTIASERYTIFSESLLTTLMLLLLLVVCRYGNNETMFLSEALSAST